MKSDILPNILVTEKSADYELLDSGDGERLEKFGSFVLRRPDPQAIWQRKLHEEEWQKADATFIRGQGAAGKWKLKNELPETWQVVLQRLTFLVEPLPSKHVGVFPEQVSHWKWLSEKISSASPRPGLGPIKVLNLFGYTGGASLVCAKAGADVVHVDASEWAVTRAKENAKLSGLETANIRYIVDDVRKFAEREIRRENTYDMIVIDAPVYGKGPNGEVWNLDSSLPELLSRVPKLLSADPVAVLLNGYASGYSHLTYAQMLAGMLSELHGNISSGELAISETGGRVLPAGIFARFEK